LAKTKQILADSESLSDQPNSEHPAADLPVLAFRPRLVLETGKSEGEWEDEVEDEPHNTFS
jgi:hypothetical protein